MEIEKEETFHMTFTRNEAETLVKALQVALSIMDTEKTEYWTLDNFEMDLQNAIKN